MSNISQELLTLAQGKSQTLGALVEAKVATLKRNGMGEATATAIVEGELQTLAPNDSTTAGSASELVPESVKLSDVVDEGVKDKRYSWISALAKGRHTVPSLTTKYPILGDVGYARGAQEWTNAGDAEFYAGLKGRKSLDSNEVTITQVGLYDSYGISHELANYSVLQIDAMMRGKLERSIMNTVADAILNADSSDGGTGNINLVDAQPSTVFADGALNHLLKFNNGIRKTALAGTNKLNIGTITGGKDIFDLASMLSFDGTPDDRIVLMDNKTYYGLMSKELIDTSITGIASTLEAGSYGRIGGMEVFVTDLVRLADATGNISNTPANNITGTIIVIDRNTIQHGFFNEIIYDVRYSVEKGFLYEARSDFGFDNIDGRAGKSKIALGYNVTVA